MVSIVVIFVSDMHFGRQSGPEERALETALIACLRHHQAQVSHLVLLGDVFDQYIEYKRLMPKGFARLQGLLAEWTDAGRKIWYLAGNHDPWHIDYFEKELGVHFFPNTCTEPLYGLNVYMAHGDQIGSRFPLYKWMKGMLRHPVPVWLYRHLLPGDAGMGLASWVNKHLHEEALNPAVTKQLRAGAQQLMRSSELDMVVLGHSHEAELTASPVGIYLNPGCWRFSQTYATLDRQALRLLRWESNEPVQITHHPLDQPLPESQTTPSKA